VKFSFERAKAAGSTNKAKKAVFDNISSIDTPDAHTVILVLNNAEAMLPVPAGREHRRDPAPRQRRRRRHQAGGHRPVQARELEQGFVGDAGEEWDGYRGAAKVKIKKVTFRFINDPAAQVAALLAGDIDGMPRFGAPQALKQFQGDKRFTVEVGSTAGKGILSINNRKARSTTCACAARSPRRSTARRSSTARWKATGKPIGSHLVPSDAGYVDLTGEPVQPGEGQGPAQGSRRGDAAERDADAAAAAVRTQGRRDRRGAAGQGGHRREDRERRVGAVAVGPFKGNYDLTIISHVEPLDYATAYADPNYYYGYDSAKFRGLVATLAATSDMKEKARLWRDIQRQLAEDAVNVYLWNPAQVAVFRKGLRGLWNSSPIFANDLAAVSWAPPASGA
jgi:peptide/nickel transport system substrate-binding protein